MATKAEFTFLSELDQIAEAYHEAISLMPDAGDPEAGAKAREMGARFVDLEQRVGNLIVPKRCKGLYRALVRFSKIVHRAPPLAQRMVAAQGVKKNFLAGQLITIWRLSKRAYRRLRQDAIEFNNNYGAELVE
jgi:hypothetical protein